jgi:hypothetical protein
MVPKERARESHLSKASNELSTSYNTVYAYGNITT